MNASTVPAAIEGALQKAACKLGAALSALNYPNGGRDAVFAETNLLVYVGHGLMTCEMPFHCYAEASHTNSRRIDMIAFDGHCALAIEAKLFGNIGYVSRSVEDDLRRLADFCPRLSPNADGFDAENWWAKASEHWGLILIGSHGGDAVRDAWKAKRSEEVEESLRTRLND